jgi:hypothetical protein
LIQRFFFVESSFIPVFNYDICNFMIGYLMPIVIFINILIEQNGFSKRNTTP